jgi:hypothetical protein
LHRSGYNIDAGLCGVEPNTGDPAVGGVFIRLGRDLAMTDEL